jgi:hypothetical protein
MLALRTMRILAAKMLSLFCGLNAKVEPPGRAEGVGVGLKRVFRAPHADPFQFCSDFSACLTLHILCCIVGFDEIQSPARALRLRVHRFDG